MPTATSPNPRAGAAAPDDLDSMLNYDQAVDDFLRDIPITDENSSNANATKSQNNEDPDAEIKIRKQRKPVPKLDEARLLSDEGIPKLRRITKSKLKFKGKGHEYSDISRMLNLYQLWLDDLYPRAKFRDGLSMVEKVGHSKRMQITRRAWMDGTRARQRAESVERVGHVEMSDAVPTQSVESGQQRDSPVDDDVFDEILRQQHQTKNARQSDEDMPEDDELDALMAETAHAPTVSSKTIQRPKGPFEEDDADDDEDDLDALLAEDTTSISRSAATVTSDQHKEGPDTRNPDSFADEEEIMAGMDW